MPVYLEQLPASLNQGLAQSYLLFGNEPLLKIEAQDLIVKEAIKQGFLDSIQYQVTHQFNWDDLYQECLDIGLFSNKKRIEITLPEKGLTPSIIKALGQLKTLLHPDIILILLGNKLQKRQESTAWFRTLLEQGIYIPCNTPLPRMMPQFVMQRCKKIGLQADHQCIEMLINYHEGNLLALHQSLEKLILIYPDGVLTLPRIDKSLSRHNHFSSYQLIDALLEQKPKRSLRILQSLKMEGIETVILLRSLQRELTLIYNIKVALTAENATQPALKKVLDSARVWQNKRPLYTQTATRLSFAILKQQLKLLAQLEIEYKMNFNTNLWSNLTVICLEVAGTHSKINHMS